jgi:hypothetical protein
VSICVPLHLARCLGLLVEVWSVSSAMAHLNVCLEIAAGAAAEKKR